ncbi:YqaI family protein [Bacillus velezensis]|uniref:YqaI family protein n=1 Tax=Bacillus TaxID=1386 RepID=UPI000458635B|nr:MULTISPECIES: hypothetical protein [Bacillus]AIW37831.1 hypothetical protein KS07_10170 [Bacillus subtilis]AHZ16310.1 skin element [Bacillus velezensis SQR9]AKF76266.1 hypothetical protein AAV30_08875 [Bacillus velezensis]AKF76306.1 hypothetical protein AAV30_09135 [Bacillus velezensis]AWD15470.1 hypothetical protein B9C53_19190 [Bacillus velezensis]
MNIENPMVLNNWHDKTSEPEMKKDFFGDIIMPTDDYVIDSGEVILRDNLERYLKEQFGFEFQTAQ